MKKASRKILSVFLSVMMVLSVIPMAGLSAFAATSGDFEYYIYSDNTCVISHYTGSATELAIPSTIDGYPVTRISVWAFFNCTSLTSVTIPKGVVRIGDFAFSCCTSLTSVYIPDSVTGIVEDAFEGCSASLTFYGVPGSCAETYAKKYNIPFISIYTGSVQSQSIQRNNIQLAVFDRDAFLEGGIEFISANTASANHRLSGVTLTVNGKSQTFDKSIALTSAQLGAQAVLSKTDYQNFLIPAEVTSSWMQSDDLSTHSVFMAKDKKDGKPYIAGAFGRESGSNVAYTDLQSEKLTALDDKSYDIILTAELRGETAKEFVLSQDDAHRLTSANGRFSAKQLTETFAAGNPVYAYVKTSSGKTSEPVKLNLDITDTILEKDTFSLTGQDGLKITLDKNNSLVGGAEISMDGFQFPLGVEVEGNRFKISFGIDIFSLKRGNDEACTWDSFKAVVNNLTDSIEGATEKLQKFDNFYNALDPNKSFQSYSNKSINFDTRFLGYIEGYIVNGKFVPTEQCGEITGKFSFQYTQQGTISVVPVYAYVKAGAGFSVKAQNVRILPDSDVPFDFGMILMVVPELTLGGGVGVKGAISGGLYGSGSLPFENNFPKKHTCVKLNGKIGLECDFFCYSTKIDLASGEVTLYDGDYGSSKTLPSKLNGILPTRQLSNKTETTVMSRAYAADTSKWLGDNFLARFFNARSTVAEGLTVKELQTSVFKNSETQLVTLNDGRMIMAYIEDNADRDTYNRMRLVYSIYENGYWSKPKAVSDDGTNDASPSLATDGENVYVAWQNLNRTLTESDADQIASILSSSEISLAKFNAETEAFGTATQLTSNAVYDYSPSVAVENGNAAVYWINNSVKDLTAEKSNTVYRYLTSAKKTEAVKSKLNYILDMESSFVNGVDEVAYSMDADGVLSGTQDVCAFRLANGVQTQVSNSDITDFDVAYGKLNGKTTLFYANSNGIYYNGENGVETVFESIRTVNGDLQVLENGNQTVLMWTEISDEGTELWICNYENGKWSEPVQLSKLGALLSNISAVYNGGTIHGVFDRTQRTLNKEGVYESGQTDLCYMTLSEYTDIEAEFAYIDETSFATGKSSPVSVYLKNNGTKDISNVNITLRDTLGTEITVQKAVDLPSGAETILDVDYPVPSSFGKTTLTVEAAVPNESEINTTNNSDSKELGLANISALDIRTDSVGEYYVFTSVITNNSLSDAANVNVKIFENGNKDTPLNLVNLGTLKAGESSSVQYIVEKDKLTYEEGLCKIEFIAETDTEEKTHADNSAYTIQTPEQESANYDEYKKAVEQAKAVDRTKYTDESLAVLDNALAVDVSGKDSTEQSVVDAQTKAILDAINSLEIKAIKKISMYRLYNPNSGEHFYTADVSEKNNLVSLGWKYEGIGWTAPKTSDKPVYRLYNQNGGEHHYTLDASERDFLVSVGWTYEGIGWYSADTNGVPVYRQYNPNAFANNHNYTTDKAENDWLVSMGWKAEGIGWYGVA